MTLNSKRLPPLWLLDMTTLVMQPTAARAIFAEMPHLMLQPKVPPSHSCALISKTAQEAFLDITLFICLPGCQTRIARQHLKWKHFINENGYSFPFMVHYIWEY